MNRDIRLQCQLEVTQMVFYISVTLHDIVHTEKSLTLVFEYLDRDLKQYMDSCGGVLSINNVKVSFQFRLLVLIIFCTNASDIVC